MGKLGDLSVKGGEESPAFLLGGFRGVESCLPPTPDVVVGPGALCLASGWLSVLGPRRYPRLPARPGEAGGPCIPTHSAAHGPAHGPLGRPPPHPRAWESVPAPRCRPRSEALWAGHPGRVLLSDSWTRHLGLQAGQGGLSHEGPAGREGGGWAGGPCALAAARAGQVGGVCAPPSPGLGACAAPPWRRAPPWGPLTHLPPSPAALWVA